MAKKKKTLPKYLTTVTPLSKLLAATLFITLPFIAFKLGMEFQEKLFCFNSDSSSESNTDWKTTTIEPSESLAIPFRKFALSYPPTWTIDEKEMALDFVFVTLSKDGAVITIKQVEEGKGDCYYSDQNKKVEGMAVEYSSFSEILKGKLIWRVSKNVQDDTLFDVCELQTDGHYRGLTSIGSISMKDLSNKNENLEDFKQILNKVLVQ